jgi:autotransporter strand-loop-strand O-heptosyltransferase
MSRHKIYAHAPYVGHTGYNNHTRDFFRHLSKYSDIKVRNWTVGKSWDGPSEEPHNGETYLTDLDKTLLHEQTLINDGNYGDRYDQQIYTNYGEDFDHDVNIILMETNHYYFYDGYKGPKIAYNVWESTLQPQGFFNKLLEYDQIWVPSKWQAECTVKQGADPDRVKVVPEGVDVDTFYPEDPVTKLDYVDGRFKFVIFGRWDYRKSTKELIETFLKEFKPEEPVDLIVSIDNPFSGDGLGTTEARLEHYGFTDERIKIKHFPSREDYITYLKNGHVFLSCARSEGWNLPLIEAMACGTPSIYSACCAQMEFAEGKGLPVKVLGEKPAQDADYNHYNTIVGNYYEPDFEDLARVMRDAYENYTDHKKRAVEEAKIIHRDFNWDNVAQIGQKTLDEFKANYKPMVIKNRIEISYNTGPKVEVIGDEDKEYFVEFINTNTNEVIHSSTIRNNMWTSCNKEYYIPWEIRINGEVKHKLELKDKVVRINLESSAIGDTISWSPYAVEFAKKHQCKVYLSTFHNDWLENLDTYKDISFLKPDEHIDALATYRIGWFRDGDGGWQNFGKHPQQCNIIPLQQTATDILGLEFKELNLGVDFPKGERPLQEKYIVFGPNATAGCKQWDQEYWVKLAEMLRERGYRVVALTANKWEVNGVINIYGTSFDNVANYLHHAEAFIGLGSGLSWFNWALGKHTYMINGFAEDGHEFTSNVTRIKTDACSPCWTNPNFVFDAGDWNWCPIWKGTDKQFICQKTITPELVLSKLAI